VFPSLCQRAAEQGIPLALIGGRPGVAEACAQRMCEQLPTLKFALISPGFFPTEEAAKAVAAQIEKIGRVIVLVGMGSPRQEQWAWQFLRNSAGATVLTVGGLFDFFSGRVRRAPIVWREIGLEWLWRLVQEPRRLAKRYLVGNPLFLLLALEQRLRGRKA